jgi:hypothetical protein
VKHIHIHTGVEMEGQWFQYSSLRLGVVSEFRGTYNSNLQLCYLRLSVQAGESDIGDEMIVKRLALKFGGTIFEFGPAQPFKLRFKLQLFPEA